MARELAQGFFLARVSNWKGDVYKVLKQLYCGLKIMASELAPVLAWDFESLLNYHPGGRPDPLKVPQAASVQYLLSH